MKDLIATLKAVAIMVPVAPYVIAKGVFFYWFIHFMEWVGGWCNNNARDNHNYLDHFDHY